MKFSKQQQTSCTFQESKLCIKIYLILRFTKLTFLDLINYLWFRVKKKKSNGYMNFGCKNKQQLYEFWRLK